MGRIHTFSLVIDNRQRSRAPTATPGPVAKAEVASTPPESKSYASEERSLHKHTSSRIKSESVSEDAEEEDDVKPSSDRRKREQRQEEEKEGARKKVKKENEDIKPVVVKEEEGSNFGRRRSNRSRPQDAVPSLYLDASDDEDDVDIKPSRSSRSRAPTAAAAAIAKVDDEDDIKQVKQEEEFRELRDLHLNYNSWPLPQGVDPETFSILDDSTWHTHLQVTGPDVDALCEVPLFHFHVLHMGTTGSYRPKTSKIRRTAGYTHAIVALEQNLNLGMKGPGGPVVETTGLRSWDPDRPPRAEDDEALFVGMKKDGTNPRWKAFGLYRLAWQGKAKDGEFLRLSEEKKKKVQSIFEGYLPGKDNFSRLVFEDCYLDVDDPEAPDGRRHIRHESIDKDMRHAHIRTCLEENRDLVMYWSLFVYTGDNAQEVADCGRRRDFRYM